MAFAGWPIEAVEFYEGLAADNSKVYWQRHREVYEQSVRAPMEQLLAELAPEFGPGKIFRPNRDVRFSADKSPYKTNCAATLGRNYVSFSADGLSVGGGLYLPTGGLAGHSRRQKPGADRTARRRAAERLAEPVRRLIVSAPTDLVVVGAGIVGLAGPAPDRTTPG